MWGWDSGSAKPAGAEEQTLPGILQFKEVDGGALKTLVWKAGQAVPKVGVQASTQPGRQRVLNQGDLWNSFC